MTTEEPDRLRLPDAQSESRLLRLREQASREGVVTGKGIRPASSPFPVASPETGYYGVPLLKPPQWTAEVPIYFFVGGAAGAAAVIAAVASWSQADEKLVNDARMIAAAGAVISPILLISDLGKPWRFLYMLRVFKPQSTMSVGAWTLTFYSNAAIASFILARWGNFLPRFLQKTLTEVSGAIAAATGMVMATYTGVLVGATSIPVWNQNVRTLPIHFAASGLNSAVAMLELMGNENRALQVLGLSASMVEAGIGAKIELENDPVHAPLKTGRSGMIVRLGGFLSGPVPFLLRLAAHLTRRKTSTKLRRVAAVCSIAGSILTREGWVSAGKSSTRDHRLPLELPPAKT